MKIKALALLLIAALLSGCVSNEPYDPVAWGINGGLAGGAVGAGTGALIGSQIANGDIAASAIFGGAVGLPAGVLLAVAYAEYERGAELREARSQVEDNGSLIEQRQQEIEELRQQLNSEQYNPRINGGGNSHPYPGATLGLH